MYVYTFIRQIMTKAPDFTLHGVSGLIDSPIYSLYSYI